MPRKIEISHRTIIFSVAFLLGIWFLYQIREIIFTLFVAFILMAALNPTVEKMEKVKIPRPLAILLIYIVFFTFFSLVIAGLVPPLVEQTAILIDQIPGYIEQVNLPWLDKEVVLSQFAQLASLPETLLKLTINIFQNLFKIIFQAVITFYLLMERKNLGKYLELLFSNNSLDRASQFVRRLEKRLGSWVRAEIFLMTIIGVMSYIGLRLVGVDFCLPLAVLAGILELIPSIGPTMSAVPAVIFGLTISSFHGVAVAALYILIQEIENSIIVPKVMGKNLGINPLLVIIALSVGIKLGGIGGAVLAVPTFLVLQEAAHEIRTSDYFPKQ
ncbi:MAG: AI-2E family transporter [Candidatus Pacebacteria bacterium]|nr:AI-2E family transporter [Candidatus Paceibacterota bacterium]